MHIRLKLTLVEVDALEVETKKYYNTCVTIPSSCVKVLGTVSYTGLVEAMHYHALKPF